MAITYTPLRQDNGVDSWIAVETDNEGRAISKYMVYEDPNKKETIRSFEKLTTEEIASFKSIIGVTGGGGSVMLNAGDGINVVDEGGGAFTISATGGARVGIKAGRGILVDEIDEGYMISSDGGGGGATYAAGQNISFSEDPKYGTLINASFNGVSSITAGRGLEVDQTTGDVTISAVSDSSVASAANIYYPTSMKVGEWYMIGNPHFIPPSNNILNNSNTLSAGVISFTPYYCLEDVTIDAIQFRGAQAAGTSTKLVVYENSPANLEPTNLLVETAGLTNAAAFGFRTAVLTRALSLTAGNTYWFGVCHSATHTTTVYPYNGHNLPIIKGNTWDFTLYEHTGRNTYTNSYNSIPASLAGFTTHTFANNCPFIRFRKSA